MSQTDDTLIEQVIQAERDWLYAHLHQDVALLDSLMADEYMQVNSRGELVSKEQVLASFLSESRHWDVAESDEYRVRVYGDAAVVYGRWRARGTNAGAPFDYVARYISVWIYRDGRWQIVSDQSTEIR